MEMEKWFEFKSSDYTLLALGTREKADRYLAKLNAAEEARMRRFLPSDAKGVAVIYDRFSLRELPPKEAARERYGDPREGTFHFDIG